MYYIIGVLCIILSQYCGRLLSKDEEAEEEEEEVDTLYVFTYSRIDIFAHNVYIP